MIWRHAMRGLLAAIFIGTSSAWAPVLGDARTVPTPTGLEDAVERYSFTYPTADGTELTLDRAIESPSTFLGYELGTRFTRHHDIVRYARYLAQVSDRVSFQVYGRSAQGRELVLVTVSSESNIDDLDDILARNLELTRPQETSENRAREIASSNPAIQWLSFGVHGNEASVCEAALQTMYTLAAGGDAVRAWLDDCVVVIDPNLNPDGRMRYISHYENAVGTRVDTTPISREHEEPWPGGRSNHYMFDLNRDWVWGTQVESRTRLAAYRTIMPQGHIDAHEQGYHSPFFMGAGDEPYSANIPQETKDWIEIYGTASANVFDRLGLPYAMRERFDYLYPGYGKVLPTYHGAVSLLTEQAGHGRGGLAIRVSDHGGPDGNGYVLTLRERTRNHWLVSMAYVELAARTHTENLLRFYEYFKSAAEGDHIQASNESVAAFVLCPEDAYTIDAIIRISSLLDMHGIEYEQLQEAVVLEQGYTTADVRWVTPLVGITDERWWEVDGIAEPIILTAGSMIIPTNQPMGRLVMTLFERDPALSEIETYDITAWSTAVMHGVRGYAWSGPRAALKTRDWAGLPQPSTFDPTDAESAIALLIDSEELAFPSVLDAARNEGILARIVGTSEGAIELPRASSDGVAQGTERFGVGSLLVHVVRNEPGALSRFIERVNALGVRAGAVSAGAPLVQTVGGKPTGRGPALGNNGNRRFVLPRIALVGGESVSSLSFGHAWHMLDVTWGIEHTRVNPDRLSRVLDDVNVVILPERWSAWGQRDELLEFVRSGGTVVALGRSSGWATRELIGLAGDENTANEDVSSSQQATASGADELYLKDQVERRERADVLRVPGALLLARVDMTHRLSAGIPKNIGFHMFTGSPLAVEDNGTVLARFAFADELVIGGHIDPFHREQLSGSPAVTLHRVGGGRVICFASDPTNRGMNIAGMRLLMNTIMLGPSEPGSLQPLRGEDARDH